MRCKHILVIRELSALLHTTHEIPHKSEGWGECFVSPPLSGIYTWSLILHPLRRMQCKHLLIIRVECTLTHNTRNLIKARDGEKTNYSGGSFSCVTSCINDEVYLPWDSFTANAKDGHLPRCKEVDWAGLQQVAGVMHLLCKIKRVLHIDRVGCWCNYPIWSI